MRTMNYHWFIFQAKLRLRYLYPLQNRALQMLTDALEAFSCSAPKLHGVFVPLLNNLIHKTRLDYLVYRRLPTSTYVKFLENIGFVRKNNWGNTILVYPKNDPVWVVTIFGWTKKEENR